MSGCLVRVVVTGACSDVGQSISYMVGKGDVFGSDTSLDLVLVENQGKMNSLTRGFVVELGMCNLPLVSKVTCTSRLEEAFKDADVIFLVAGVVHLPGFSRSDVISLNALEYKAVGQALQRVGIKREAKILVVADPQNINLQVVKYFCPSLPPANITGLSRVDQNRAATCIARMLDIAINKVSHLTVWGNRSTHIFLDVRHARVELCGQTLPAYDAIQDDFFLKYKFNHVVQGRQAEIEKKRKSSLCLPVAAASIQHMRDWVHGTPAGGRCSMVVLSDGSYSIEEGLAYSFPVQISPPGHWEVVQGLDINHFERENLDERAAEVRRERQFAYTVLDLPEARTDDVEDQVKPPPWSFGSGSVVPCSVLGVLEKDRMDTF